MKILMIIGIWILSGAVGYFSFGIISGVYEERMGYDNILLSEISRRYVYEYVERTCNGPILKSVFYGWIVPLLFWPVQLWIFIKADMTAMDILDQAKKEKS